MQSNCPLYSQPETSVTPLHMRSGGHQSRLNDWEKYKIPFSFLESNIDPSVAYSKYSLLRLPNIMVLSPDSIYSYG